MEWLPTVGEKNSFRNTVQYFPLSRLAGKNNGKEEEEEDCGRQWVRVTCLTFFSFLYFISRRHEYFFLLRDYAAERSIAAHFWESEWKKEEKRTHIFYFCVRTYELKIHIKALRDKVETRAGNVGPT